MTRPHLELQVEEPSMEAVLTELLPRLLGERASWQIANYSSKDRLLRKLPDRLRGYARRLSSEPHLRVIVLVDQDSQPCRPLKERLEEMARMAGLVTGSAVVAPGAPFTVLNRIVVHELESWLLGDVTALRDCFPRLSVTLDRRAGMRDPDGIVNAWETLHRHLQKAGELDSVYPKIDVARRVAARLDPERSRSTSFRVFCRGIESLLA